MPRWGLAILLSLGTGTQQVVCSVVTLHLVTPVTHVAMLQEQGEAALEQGTSGATNLTLEVATIILALFTTAVNGSSRKC